MPKKPQGKARRKATETQILVAIGKAGGIHQATAKLCGISRQALSQRIASSETLQGAVAEAKEANLDMAETGLIKAIKKGHGWAIKYYLSRIGRDRGYGQKLEIDGSLHSTGEVIVLELPGNGRDGDSNQIIEAATTDSADNA